MRNYELSIKDKRIVETLCDNARLSYNQIARLTGISKDSVSARIKKMKEELFILSYFPLINYKKIKLNLFHVYIRILPSEKPDKFFLNKAIASSEIVSVTWLAGKYDLELQVVCKNKKETIKKIKEVISNSKIKEMLVLKSEKLEIYTMSINSDKINKTIETNDNAPHLDKKDIQLISLLAENGRAKTIDLAEKLNLEEYQVRYKIKRLLKEKAIEGFYTRTNKHRYGLSSYIILLKTNKPITKEKVNDLKKLTNLYYLKNCSRKYNYILRFHSKDNKELITTLLAIRNILDKELKNFEIFSLLERRKFLPFKV